MKGSVQIYGITPEGNKELLMQQDNLTTVGFSEQITDLLTTPSSIQFPTSTNTDCLDSSNYEIQGFSMSKNIEQFKNNLHTYTTTNLLHNSDLKELTGWQPLTNATLAQNVVGGFSPGVSGSLLVGTTSGGSFAQQVKYNNATGEFSSGFFSGTSMVASIDMKFNRDNPPAQLSSNADGYIGQSAFSIYHGNKTTRTLVMWNSSGEASLLDTRGTSDWLGGIRELSGGWYRIFLQTREATNANLSVFTVFPSVGIDPLLAYGDTTDVAGSAGSIYIARPQLELGRVPTNYVETSSYFTNRDNTLAYSILNETKPYGRNAGDYSTYNFYVASGTGGLSISSIYKDQSGDKGLSAYIPSSNSVTPPPHPDDRALTKGARTPVEKALGIEFIHGQIPNALDISANLQLSTYNKTWSYTSGYISPIGRHVGYLGCYGAREARPLSYLHFVSALDFAGYLNPLKSTIFYNGANQKCTDRFGYWELSANGTISPENLEATATDFIKTAARGIGPSKLQSFSSTGEITYHIQLPNTQSPSYQRDCPWLNTFGGVDTLGLWGLDLKKIREDDMTANPPYSRGHPSHSVNPNYVDAQVAPERRYKLFNKLVLTDNLVKMAGKNDGSLDLSGFAGNYTTLDIYWKIKFL